jgi:hypothetical protein
MTLQGKVKEEYTKLVDRLMCAPDLCNCPKETEVVKIWTAVPEKKLRSFGRIASNMDYTPEERTKMATDGTYDAPVIIFAYDEKVYNSTYKECYDGNLTKIFKEEEAKPDNKKDPELINTMKMVDKFFNGGGYTLLSDFEKKFNCASICTTPLFYLSKNVIEGPPTQDCLTASVEAIGKNVGPAVIAAVTGILLLISTASGFVLCSKTRPEDEDYMDDDK